MNALARLGVLLSLVAVAPAVLAAPSDKNAQDFEFVEDRVQTTSAAGTRTWLLDPDNALCSLLRCGKREVCLLQDRFTAVCVDKDEVARSGDRVVALNPTGNSDKKERYSGEEAFPYFTQSDDTTDDDEDEDDDEDNDGDEDEYNYQGDEEEKITPTPLSPQLNMEPFAPSKHCGDCPLTRPVFLCGSDNRTYSSTCRLHLHNCLHQAKVQVTCKGFCPCKESSGRRSSRRGKTSLMAKMRATQQQRQASQLGDEDSDVFRKNKFNNRKFKKFNKNSQRKKPQNKKHPGSSNNVWGPNECSQDALAAMGNRMLDWFSVIMSDSRNQKQGLQTPKNAKGPIWCKREVSWMLGHLDTDRSGQLEARELYQLEHDDRERCIKPFLDRCDLDRDGELSAREWCKCFDKSERPCAAVRTASQELGGYIPECDSEGWYRPVQCNGNVECWCVDRHGVELPSTRTRNTPKCDSVPQTRKLSPSTDTRGDDEDEETYIEGSADLPLDI